MFDLYDEKDILILNQDRFNIEMQVFEKIFGRELQFLAFFVDIDLVFNSQYDEVNVFSVHCMCSKAYENDCF